jgi:hypothetical protein
VDDFLYLPGHGRLLETSSFHSLDLYFGVSHFSEPTVVYWKCPRLRGHSHTWVVSTFKMPQSYLGGVHNSYLWLYIQDIHTSRPIFVCWRCPQLIAAGRILEVPTSHSRWSYIGAVHIVESMVVYWGCPLLLEYFFFIKILSLYFST